MPGCGPRVGGPVDPILLSMSVRCCMACRPGTASARGLRRACCKRTRLFAARGSCGRYAQQTRELRGAACAASPGCRAKRGCRHLIRLCCTACRLRSTSSANHAASAPTPCTSPPVVPAVSAGAAMLCFPFFCMSPWSGIGCVRLYSCSPLHALSDIYGMPHWHLAFSLGTGDHGIRGCKCMPSMKLC